QEMDRRLRAFRPWPGGYFDHGSTRIKVGRAAWSPADPAARPGTVLAAGDTLDVATGEGVLQIHELQRPGGKMLPAKEFLKGYPIEIGAVLPSVPGEDLLRSDSA
ncbi:MAG TPA: methionyl-tRNA formyltransferase, partial [Opitutales bacterium]|nr:methionyl-tRNA formyltransferase [Opitutales bacterium]